MNKGAVTALLSACLARVASAYVCAAPYVSVGHPGIGGGCYYVTPHTLDGDGFCPEPNWGNNWTEIRAYWELNLLLNARMIHHNTTYYIDSDIWSLANDQRYTGLSKASPPRQVDNCVVIDGHLHFRWREVDCSERHPVICSHPPGKEF